jgi:hypothetical protein
MPLATSATVHVIAQNVTENTHVKQQWAKRSEVGKYTFKNKYKLMILKSIMMPQVKEAFVAFEHKYKIYITIAILFLFWCLVYRRNNS